MLKLKIVFSAFITMLFVISSPRLLSLIKPPPFFSLQNLGFSPKNLCLSTRMESESSTKLMLCGKSAAEDELARCLKANNALKLPDGSPVTVYLHSESDRAGNDNDDVFRVNSYMNSISTSRFGRLLVYSPRLASTHDVVANNFGELPIGSVCVADVQLKGRGRSKNVWGIILSTNSNLRCHGMPSLDVRIKWPNDLYLDGLKVGGILCTSTYKSKKFNISAGIGLNIDNQKPTTCLNAALQRLGYAANQLQREDIISAFFNKFEVFHDMFLSQGFQALENLYYKTWLHSGQRVIVQEKNESEDQVSENVVTIQGLTPSGYLLAATDDGQICELHPDGNSFDFFQGLVRRKLA
ncbi:biotin--protein ligase 2-like [Salvia hispanica]|uniref:biotin--protein ligase 2-like n=1 Tax=Salvia hispanica TaxID=49212 RepID=UPI002009A8DD|nr:biotin--protein ligase 2-like [Salvia hispanica]